MPSEPDVPDVPDAFDVHTVVVLRLRPDAPDLGDDELDDLQRRHLAYRADLERRGLVAVRGPFDAQSDPSYRGMSIFTCDPAESARLSAGDPSVLAGRLSYDVMEWWVRAGTLAFRGSGDRMTVGGVGTAQGKETTPQDEETS